MKLEITKELHKHVVSGKKFYRLVMRVDGEIKTVIDSLPAWKPRHIKKYMKELFEHMKRRGAV